MLSSISHSVNDPEKLKNKIGNLSLLLRNVIENIEHTAIPLNEELLIVKKSVELQQDRISLPFNFEIDIDPELKTDMLVPAMIVQIPVENALKHGLMPKQDGACTLTISASKTENGSLILVADNGVGMKDQFEKISTSGTGLKMVMQTIQFLNSKNKNKIKFSVKEGNNNNENSSGTIVEIFIPFDFSFQIQSER
jgi:LytS/YehU family sensor histidine kinase